MTKPDAYILVISAVFILVGCALGWWIIYELIDPQLATRFLYGAFAIGSTLLYIQALLAVKARVNLVLLLLFSAGVHVAIAWTALCLFMPLMFFHDLSNYAKLSSALVVIVYCTINVRTALRSAKDLWHRYGAFAFSNHLNASQTSVNWEKVDNAISHRTPVKPIGMPHRWHSICSNILYGFAVAGLYVAGLYSVFAVITWAIPATIIAGVQLQHASHSFFQAYSVWIWQKENGTVLKSPTVPTKKKRKRKQQ